MEEEITFAQEMAHESAKCIMQYFGAGVAVERKADHSPVTIADREAEQLMRGMIEKRFPEHSVLGEEEGSSGDPAAPRQWVLDPIDGTKSFIHGVPLFGTLIALLEFGRPILGVINLPVSREMLVGAQGRATTLNGHSVKVSTTTDLSESTVLYTSSANLARLGHGRALGEIQARAGLVRGWGDCYGHFLVATGRAEAMLDPILNPWDIAALRPCIEGAGGRLTEFNGNQPDLGENALSTNGALHDELLAILNREGE